MMNQPPSASKCTECGAALAPDAPEGLCPRCLMALNLTPQTEVPGEEVGPMGTRVVRRLPEEPLSPAEVARHFPHLEIVECLGRGGMGVVYKARQPRLNRWVALKLLAPERERDGRFVERFTREAQALAQLSHPNIVTVYDFGEAAGLCYLLMEYADGVSLRQLLQTQRLPPDEALKIVPKICEALQFAHERGIVHRDIKPENILLDKQGRVKIADFGIAKMLGLDAARPALTEDKQVIGTPHYMAPEQVEKPHTVDHRADIYSLGVVFYEMLTGELPLGKFPPPSRKASIDGRLDDVVLHALEKEPERRYQHATDVQADVESIASTPDRPPPIIPPESSSTAPGLPSANGADAGGPEALGRRTGRRWLWALGVAAVLIMLGSAAYFVGTRKPAKTSAANLTEATARVKRTGAASPAAWTRAPAFASPASIVFPPDAGVVDVSKPPYNAKGDGRTDDTAAIQQALVDFPGQHAIIYLPNGTYLVSDTLRWGAEAKRTTLQGQSRDGTIIQLKDTCPGFGNPENAQAVVWTGPAAPDRYRNSVRNLTIATGRGNPGAIGLQFNANMVGCVRDLLIRSDDGQGVIGLDLAYIGTSGPLLVKNLVVRGFDYGIATSEALHSQTFEHIALEGQNQAGFVNKAGHVSLRDFQTTGRVPAFVQRHFMGLAVILDAQFHGTDEARNKAAIYSHAGLFARNVSVHGFAAAIAHTGPAGQLQVPGPLVKEWASQRLPGSRPSLKLAVKETPEVPWDDLAEWANPVSFGARPGDQEDDSDALQQAIDSGARTVYLPRGEYVLGKTVLLRGKVNRLIGCEATVRAIDWAAPGPLLKLTDGEAPAVVVERVHFAFEGAIRPTFIDNPTQRALVLRDCAEIESEFTGPGEVFLENISGKMIFHGQKIWARQINQHSVLSSPPGRWWHLRNEGGTLWVLGEMVAGPGPVAVTTRGGQTEVLGGLMYSSAAATLQSEPAFVLEDAALSVSMGEASYRTGVLYPVLVRQTRNGESHDVLLPGHAPGGINGSLIPLFATD